MNSPSIKAFSEDLHDGEILVNYQGEVNEGKISEILGDVEQKLESTEEDFKKQRKVYNILVETLQNLFHHTEKLDIEGKDIADTQKKATFILGRKQGEYNILAANYIDLENIPPLKAKLDKINSLDKDGLRDYYKEVLDNGQYSVHGGGGLGIIDIARKSKQKLEYDFSQISDYVGLYVLKIKVK